MLNLKFVTRAPPVAGALPHLGLSQRRTITGTWVFGRIRTGCDFHHVPGQRIVASAAPVASPPGSPGAQMLRTRPRPPTRKTASLTRGLAAIERDRALSRGAEACGSV